MTGVLKGVRVLELGQVFAGPFAGAILADLGADVIKIERTEGGDDARRMGVAFRRGDALNFHIFNRGKQSLALDLKTDAGRAHLEQLIAQTDIFIHNLRPGVPEALGVDGATLCARYPQLIYGAISAFGNVGPMALRPGYEPLLQAFSGLSSINGGPNDPPMRAGVSLCDQGAGMWLVIGALALLHRRAQTGRGGLLDTSLLETALTWHAQKSDAFVNQGQLPARHRSGHPDFVPYEAFETADGALLICCGNDRLFAKLAHALEHAQWMTDPRFATNRDRLQHQAALLAQLKPMLRTRTRAEWIARFEAVGVPCAPVHTMAEALAHPQVRALKMRVPVPDADFSLTALPLRIDGARPALRGCAPSLGEHNTHHGVPDPKSFTHSETST